MGLIILILRGKHLYLRRVRVGSMKNIRVGYGRRGERLSGMGFLWWIKNV